MEQDLFFRTCNHQCIVPLGRTPPIPRRQGRREKLWSKLSRAIIPGIISNFLKENEDYEASVRQAIFLCFGIATSFLSFCYAVAYWAFMGESISSALSFMYMVTISSAMILSKRKRNFQIFALVLHGSLVFFPVAVHLSLGGFFYAGGVLMWGLFAPFSAYFLRLTYRKELTWLYVLCCTMCTILDLFRGVPKQYLGPSIVMAYSHFVFISIFLIFVIGYYTEKLNDEKNRGDELLENIFPHSVVDRLKRGEGRIVDDIDQGSVLFADIVGFSTMADSMEASEVVTMLNLVFSAFDKLTVRHGAEKIKTIGDAYMVGSNISARTEFHAQTLANLALDMMEAIKFLRIILNRDLHIRIGVASGPLVAGIIGIQHGVFDIYGTTVNLASRMESTSLVDCIQLNETTAQILETSGYLIQERGSIDIKGLGQRKTFMLLGAPPMLVYKQLQT